MSGLPTDTESDDLAEDMSDNSGESTPTIVLVDDEEMVVTSIKSFLTLETDYAVHAFTSAASKV